MNIHDFDGIVKGILEYSNYQAAPFKNRISGSSYGEPIQRVVLNRRYDDKIPPEPSENKINLVLGTAFHYILEYSDTDKYLEAAGSNWRVFGKEVPMHWIDPDTEVAFTGTADLILVNEKDELMICDAKTMRSGKNVDFSKKYGKQMSIYAFIAHKFYNRTVLDKGLVIAYDKTQNKIYNQLIDLHAVDPSGYAKQIAEAEKLPDDQLPECTEEETNYGKICSTYCRVKSFCKQIQRQHNPFGDGFKVK